MMKVLITRPRSQAKVFAQALAAAGFEPVFFPVIEIRPIQENPALEEAIRRLHEYDWVVFTSVNGVAIFFEHLQRASAQAGDPAPLTRVKVAAIGPKTADALRQQGIEPNFVPEEYVAEAILPGLGDLTGRQVLLPRAETARKALPEGIAAAGGTAHDIALYQTLPARPDPNGLAALKAGVAVVTFTSPSTVENFTLLAQGAGLDPLHLPGRPRVACIGPITAQAASEHGFTHLLIAEDYTTEGLVKLLRSAAQEQR